MRAYLWSFVAVALYGLLQFFGPLLLHVTMPFTVQWIVHGRVARINAFSYEPSYYATYMFIGWAMLFQLRLSNAEITRGRTMKWATILVTALPDPFHQQDRMALHHRGGGRTVHATYVAAYAFGVAADQARDI